MMLIDEIQEDIDQPRIEIWVGDEQDNRLKESIERFGLLMPIYVSNFRRMPTIIDGHRRYRAAKLLGLESVPCLLYHALSELERHILRYRLNNPPKRR